MRGALQKQGFNNKRCQASESGPLTVEEEKCISVSISAPPG